MQVQDQNAELLFESIYNILKILVISAVNKSLASLAPAPSQEQVDELLRAILSDERSELSLTDRCYDITQRLQKLKPSLVANSQKNPNFSQHYDSLLANLSFAWTEMFKVSVHDSLISKEVKGSFVGQFDPDLDKTFDNLKQLMLYSAINRRISDRYAAIITILDAEDFKHEGAQQGAPENSANIAKRRVTEVFIQPLLVCKTKENYKQYLIAVLKDLANNPIDDKLRRQLLNCVTEIYLSIKNNKNKIEEANFTDAEDVEVKKAFNGCYVEIARNTLIELIDKFKINNNWFAQLPPGNQLLTRIGALEDELKSADGVKRNQSFENLIALILENIKSSENVKIKPLLESMLQHFRQWFVGTPALILLEDNSLIKPRLMMLQDGLVSQLTGYQEKRRSNLRLNLVDWFERKDPAFRQLTTKDKRLADADRVKTNLMAQVSLASMSQAVATINEIVLGQEPAGIPPISDTSGLRQVLISSQELIAKIAIAINSSSSDISSINNQANVRFNTQVVKDFQVYIDDRKPKTFLSYLWKQGVRRTLFEYLLPKDYQTKRRDNCIKYAEYIKDKIQACKNPQDYVDLTLDIAFAVLTQNVDTELKEMLIGYQQLIVDRFVVYRTDVNFTLEQKILMSLAMEKVGNKDQVYEKLKNQIMATQSELGSKSYSIVETGTDFKKVLVYAGARIKIHLNMTADVEKISKVQNFIIGMQSKALGEFLASKVISTGKVTAANSGPLAKYAQLIGYIGTINNLFSIPLVTQVANATSQYIQGVDKASIQQQHNRNADLFPDFKKMEILIACLAYKITYRYAYQIQQLHPEDVAMVMECALERVMQFIGSGKVKELASGTDAEKFEYLLNQLMMAVSNNELRHSSLPLTKKTIRNKQVDESYSNQGDWSVEEMFSQAGIVVFPKDGGEPRYYAKHLNGNFVVPKYGYMVGTEAEALHYGLSLVSNTNKPNVEHPAASERVKALTTWVDTEKDIKSALDKLTNEVEVVKQQLASVRADLAAEKAINANNAERLRIIEKEKDEKEEKIKLFDQQIDFLARKSEINDRKTEELEKTLKAILAAENQKHLLYEKINKKPNEEESSSVIPPVALNDKTGENNVPRQHQ